MLDSQIIADIVQAWQLDQDHPHRGRAKIKLPDIAVLRKFFDEAFFATLRDEENQQVHFAICLVADSDIEQQDQDARQLPVQFEHPLAFNSQSLAKLSQAHDPTISRLVVHWSNVANEFKCIGLLFIEQANRFTQTGFAPSTQKNCLIRGADFFTLISSGRGSLTIARGDSRIGTFQSGYFKPASVGVLTVQHSSLGSGFHQLVSASGLYTKHGNTYWHHIRDATELLLSEIVSLQHGGTVVILPTIPNSENSYFSIKYPVVGSFELPSLIEGCMEHSDKISWRDGYNKSIHSAIRRIAKLSAVDGAVILSANLEVVGFGATLTAPRSELEAHLGSVGTGVLDTAKFEINRYGTRHRSAFDFASSVPGAIVFVISQDGPVRAFRKSSDDHVSVWPDCLSSMFI